MIIDNATIQFQTQHYALQQQTTVDRLQTSDEPALEPPLKMNVAPQISEPVAAETLQPDAMQSLKAQIVKMLYQRITGQAFSVFSASDLKAKSLDNELEISPASAAGDNNAGLMLYQRTVTYQEEEVSEFSASGRIMTADGREIEIQAQLNMSRAYRSQLDIVVDAEGKQVIDPLVINFEGKAAELTQRYFEFDLDADGRVEHIPELGSGSGLLVYDKNQDGVVNDGNELFGPISGNGFAELAAYDQDHNQFIDEADEIYDRLKIWRRSSDGSETLSSLKANDIGAIYLQHAETPFQLKTSTNQSLGEITDSGIYLTEQGDAGVIQQINYSV